MTFPKVLIIGQPFNNVTGGGITLSNLFRGWDKEKIAVACFPHLIDKYTNTEICNTYYQFGFKEHKMIFPFNLLKNKYYSGPVNFNSQLDKPINYRSNFRVKIIKDYFNPALKFLGLYYYVSKIKLSQEFCNWMNNFNPDIIYAQAASRDGILFIKSVNDYINKPFIFHMMDDWPSLIGRKGLFKKIRQKKFDFEFKAMLDKATLLMGISDLMNQEYNRRYGKNFIVFHNPIDINFWKKSQKLNYHLGKPPYLLYAGRTGLGINKSLEKIAIAVQYINDKINVSLKFKLQVSECPSWLSKYSCMEYNSFVPYNELPKVFSEADFLILPYDFSIESFKYVQFSMPTKAPEYMISGTPIIVFAPEDTAIVKYAKEYKWAKVVSEYNTKALSHVIIHLIQNMEERISLGHIAKKIAEERHNSVIVTNKFRTLISSLYKKSIYE